MTRKFLTLCLIIISVFGFLFYSESQAANEIRIDNFSIVQQTISSSPSNVDFRLTLSQSQPLDCSFVPLYNGSLRWVVWYSIASNQTTVVHEQSVPLPLSPTPKNLDFSIPNFTPDSRAQSAGNMTFRAAVGCTTWIAPSNLSQNIAVSQLVSRRLTGGGTGGGPCTGTGGQPIPCPGQTASVSFEIPNPIQATSLIDLAKAIGKFLLQIAIPIAVIVIIYAGLLFLTSGGSPDKINKARTALLYAVVGLAIILIGQGFFVLIKSILDLGGPPTQ